MEKTTEQSQLRSPIVTVCGHVDHGKTSLLDALRGTSLQESEAGGITQKISFTRYPAKQICNACPLVEKQGLTLEIPGFLFIDTPGHAAFTNLRKRGGSLADLAIVVVSIKEGMKPQTVEVLQILRSNKTPFVVALNKLDSISGWQTKVGGSLKETLDLQPINVRSEFDESLLVFQDSLKNQGFDSALYYEISDFAKQVALVPCSARTEEGMPELLLVLCGLCQKYLKKRLTRTQEAKGVILEMKKERGFSTAEAIIYDGKLDEGDELVIASLDEPVIAKVRAISEIQPLSTKFLPADHVRAAAGVRMMLATTGDVMPGMPFEEVKSGDDKEEIKVQFKKELAGALQVDSEGIIIKADSLGSLEALMTLLRQEHVPIVRAGIGPIAKTDVSAAKANVTINPLDAIIVGFNVNMDDDVKISPGVKVITNEVVYKLIEDLQIWRKERQAEIEKERMMGLATICKLEILPQYVFRNSNPAIFGVRVLAGKAKVGIPLIDDKGEEVAHIKGLQHEKASVEAATEGQEVAMSLPGIAFDRRLKDVHYLYANVSESQFKQFKKNKDLLLASELKVLQELASIGLFENT